MSCSPMIYRFFHHFKLYENQVIERLAEQFNYKLSLLTRIYLNKQVHQKSTTRAHLIQSSAMVSFQECRIAVLSTILYINIPF